VTTLPASVDLRSHCPPIYDQGVLQSCTANALAAAFRFLEIRGGLSSFDPSRLFIYYNVRALENDTDNNAPAYLRDGIKSIATNGICSEQAWPYNELMYVQMPPDPCFQSAQAYKTLTYYSLDNGNLDELKTCLAAGFPFVFGFSLYPSFHNADTNGGIVPMPGDESLLGGHAVLAVGYNDATASFIVQNSWGPTLGKDGFYFIPYDYIKSNLADSFWTVRTISSPPAADNGSVPAAVMRQPFRQKSEARAPPNWRGIWPKRKSIFPSSRRLSPNMAI
jgi:C1A family cysteine protease